MLSQLSRKERRDRRHRRLRKKLQGTLQRPRLAVYRSLRHFHVQLIDDIAGRTLLGLSTLDPEFRGKTKNFSSCQGAQIIGTLLADRAKQKGMTRVVFDRGGLAYHGAVQVLAEAARQGGLEF